MVDLNQIKRAETDLSYWKEQALEWWRKYLQNKKMIRKLREENRRIRLLLSDYVHEEAEDFVEREEYIEDQDKLDDDNSITPE